MSALIDTLSSYVPTLITRQLATDPTPISEPTGEAIPAAVLSVGVSGLNAIYQELAGHGPAAAEELAKPLNLCYGPVIDLIGAHGGDIIRLDAGRLVALWPARVGLFPDLEEDLGLVTQRAVQCGLAVQQALASTETGATDHLQWRMAVATGQVTALHLGGVYKRWEFVVTGQPLTQLAQAGCLAQTGDVVVSPQAWALVREDCTGQQLEKGHVRLEAVQNRITPRPIITAQLSTEAEAALRAYIPGAILADLAAGQGNRPSELRPITCLVIRLPELKSATPLDRIQMAICNLQEVLYLYEGSLHQLSISDEATTMVAAMGLPPLGHENDAARAVSAALSIRRSLEKIHLTYAIGITSGQALCSSIGTARRQNYVISGDILGQAAQFVQVATAPAGVLVSAKPIKAAAQPNGRHASPVAIEVKQAFNRQTTTGTASGQNMGQDQPPGAEPTAFGHSGRPGPATILCDRTTAEAARAQVNFESLPAISIESSSEPIPVFRPLGRPAIFKPNSAAPSQKNGRNVAGPDTDLSPEVLGYLTPEVQLVGRAREKMEFTDHIQALLRGAGSVVIVEGEVGLGKSSLLDAACRHARALGVGVLAASGDSTGMAMPYYVWRSVFARIFDLELAAAGNRPDQRQITGILERIGQVDPGLVPMAPLLNIVLPLNLPDNELTAQMAGSVRAHNTNELLMRLLQDSVNDSAKLLVIDDAHWLDSASWALLRLVSLEVDPLQLFIAMQPLAKPRSSECEQLIKASTSRYLRLAPLPTQDTITVACRRLGVDSLPAAIGTLIKEKAAGNPLYSETLVTALRDSGYLEVVGGECRVRANARDLEGLDFTGATELGIARHLTCLPPDRQRELEAASVAGRAAAPHNLSPSYQRDAGSIPPGDHPAETVQQANSGFEATVFEQPGHVTHPLILEIVYGSLSRDRSRALHRSVAGWLKHMYKKALPFYYPLLAYHWRTAVEAGATEPVVVRQAIDYLDKAGEQALLYGAYREAAQVVSQAVVLSDSFEPGHDPLRQARRERQLGEALFALDQLAESREHFERAVTLLGSPVPETGFRLVTNSIKQLIVRSLHRYWPAKRVEQASAVAATTETVRAYEQLTSIYELENDRRRLANAALHTLNLAESAGSSPDLARAYAESCVAASTFSLRTIAEDFQHQAEEKARTLAECPVQVQVLEASGRYSVGVGHWAQARDTLEEAAVIADHLRDQRRRCECLDLLGSLAYHQGQFEHSSALFVDAYASACRRGDTRFPRSALLGHAQSELRLDHADQTLTLLEAARNSFCHELDSAVEIWTYGLLSLAHLRRGNRLEAHRSAKTAAALIEETQPNSLYSLEAYADVAEVYLSLWEAHADLLSAEHQTLARSVRLSCRALHNFARIFPIGQPRAWLIQGLYEWHRGKAGKAHRAWQKGLTYAEQLEMPYEAGLAHYEIGRHLPFDDPDLEIHLARACELFAGSAAKYDLRRARESLAARI